MSSVRWPARLRTELLQEIARMFTAGEVRDLESARRKAGERYAVDPQRVGLSDEEIEDAVVEYWRLFAPQRHADALRSKRRCALEAMAFFERFSPEAVGGVVSGALNVHTPVRLRLYADQAEDVLIQLIGSNIPFSQADITVNLQKGKRKTFPLLIVETGDVEFELVIFPRALYPFPGRRGIAGKADAERLRVLLEATAPVGGYERLMGR